MSYFQIICEDLCRQGNVFDSLGGAIEEWNTYENTDGCYIESVAVIRAYDIEYSYDEEGGKYDAADLPEEWPISLDSFTRVYGEDVGEYLADCISDLTGWCVEACQYEIIAPDYTFA